MDPRSEIVERMSGSGYALPSVLMLIVILSLVAGSVVTLQYHRRLEVLGEMHLTKSDFAARNGVARALAKVSADPSLLEGRKPLQFGESYDDSTRSHVSLRSWGMFIAARAEGYSARFSSKLTLLSANRLTKEYSPALTLGNLQHQLVMTGNAHITGDVILGPSGATTGTLRDHTTPLSLPIDGRIKATQSRSMPQSRGAWVEALARDYRALLSVGGGVESATRALTPDSAGRLCLTDEDTVEFIRVTGSVRFTGELRRYWPPLVVAIDGALRLAPGAHLDGLVLLAASDSITVQQGATIEDAILLSLQSVRVQEGAEITAQAIAPKVVLKPRSALRYPSAAVALDLGDERLAPLTLQIDSGAMIEGFAGVLSSRGRSNPEDQATFESSSRVVGVIYASCRTTLGGSVIGSVATDDFYFYQAPTHYYSWMKEGSIDRTRLPKGLLIPMAVAEKPQLDILKWVM